MPEAHSCYHRSTDHRCECIVGRDHDAAQFVHPDSTGSTERQVEL